MRFFQVLAISTVCFLAFQARGLAQPVIGTDGVVNAASYLPSGFPNSGIAEGAIFDIFGTGLGPATVVFANPFPFPTSLGNTSISVTVAGTTTTPYLLFTSAGQVSAIMPSNTPVGTGTITLTYNGQASAAAPITVVKSSFAEFTYNQQGTGPAVVTTAKFAPVTLTSPAKPGDILILWGTGLGPVQGNEAGMALPGDLGLPVTFYVGDNIANESYAGRSGCCSGVDQVVFTVPTNTVTGCYVPISMVVNGVGTNFGSMAISSDGSTCSDPYGLPTSVITKAATGTANVANILLSRLSSEFNLQVIGKQSASEDSAEGFFYHYDSSNFLDSVNGAQGVSSLSSFNACTVANCRGVNCVPTNLRVSSLPGLDAGANLSVTGPKGSATLPKISLGDYSANIGQNSIVPLPGYPTNNGSAINPFLEPGNFTVTGPGGADIGAFTATTSVSTANSITWTNKIAAGTTLQRSQPITVNWTGGGANDWVSIAGTSTTNAPAVTATFTCLAPANAGTFTVPSWVVSALPASGMISVGGLSAPGGFVILGDFNFSGTFTAPGLDYGLINTLALSGENVIFQ